MEGSRQCLIITAKIKPNSVVVAQLDEKQRRLEYLVVLQYYIKNYQSAIYFIENSAYNFEEDSEFSTLFAMENVYLIKHTPSNEYTKGKGYQEFEMMDKTIVQIGEYFDEFIKITGRYKVTNFNQLKNQKNKGFVIDRHKKRKVAITSFFKCLITEYDDFVKGAFKEVDDSKEINIENILYNRLSEINQNIINLFNFSYFYVGFYCSFCFSFI
ncbi:MAG: hypothetical protein QMB65_13410 [Vicingaceae bacterium]